MEIPEILSQIERATGKFARAAVEAAIARKEEITPELLRIMDDTVNRAAELDADRGYMAHLYAMFLLAQFREVRAYPLLVRFALLPGGLVDSMCGDILTEDFGRVLASVSGGDPGGIRSIIENEDAGEWVRAVAFTGLITLVAEEQLNRDEAMAYFGQLFRGKLIRRPSEAWNSLVASASDLHPAELMPDIEQAYRDGLVDPGNISIEDVERDLASGLDRSLRRLADDRHHRMVEDTIKEMEWWACFHREESDKTSLAPSVITTPVQHVKPKVGRNEPCLCGSGKKYKKCCGG